MPITKSAIKTLRKEKRKNKINLLWRKKYKTAVKNAKAKPTAKNITLAYSVLDKAAKEKVIHKNKASRYKSRLAKLIKK